MLAALYPDYPVMLIYTRYRLEKFIPPDILWPVFGRNDMGEEFRTYNSLIVCPANAKIAAIRGYLEHARRHMVTQKLAEFVINTPYESIPEDARLSAKRAILDCLGVTLAGVSDPGSKLVTEFVKSHGGKPESGVIGAGFKTIASEAALANGTMAHILDYDDYCISFLGHPSVAILPAVLALAEREHAEVSAPESDSQAVFWPTPASNRLTLMQ